MKTRHRRSSLPLTFPTPRPR